MQAFACSHLLLATLMQCFYSDRDLKNIRYSMSAKYNSLKFKSISILFKKALARLNKKR